MGLSERSRFQAGVFISCVILYVMIYGILLITMDILFHLVEDNSVAYALGSTIIPFMFGIYGIHLLAESLTKVLFD